MLTQRYSQEFLAAHLAPHGRWKPFPQVGERGAWNGLRPALRELALAHGGQQLDFAWPALPAERYLDFVRTGDRVRFESLYFARRRALAALVLAECMEGQGRFLDQVVNGIWAVCEESSWMVPAHAKMQRAGVGLPDIREPCVDLFAGETAALLAWTCYLLAEPLNGISIRIIPRVEGEINDRVLTPLLERDDFPWMGFGPGFLNNWNPWIVSNWLTATLLAEGNPSRRIDAVYKAMRTLDNFIDSYPSDGGCDEGPGYWNRAGGSLFDSLEWLHGASGGRIDIYDQPLIREIGRYIYRVQIADRYFVNFADAGAVAMPPAAVCLGYGQRIGDRQLMALGAWTAAQYRASEIEQNVRCLGRCLPAIWNHDDRPDNAPVPPLPRDVFLDRIHVFAARDTAGSAQGFFVAAKGGHNAESHNHNDVGQVIVYLDGAPVLVDAGVERYTAKTFGPERYTIWTMQSAYHSLPTLNGHLQSPGKSFAAQKVTRVADDETAQFSLDLAGAYPAEAAVRCYHRVVTLHRQQGVTVQDTYALDDIHGDTAFHVLTACRPEIQEPGRVALNARALADGRVSGEARLDYDSAAFSAIIETISLETSSLRGVWGDALFRLVFKPLQAAVRGEWSIRITRKESEPW